MLTGRYRCGKMYFSGFADLGLGFAGIGAFENPRLQNPGFRNPEQLFCVTLRAFLRDPSRF